ncbi:MAG: putative collagen-binding domain-containing protein [Parabacteroides sp.]|nr:putative collagen-binding domain-containing protein [Parabacteroides sp.]MDD4403728.1 putative collagen-binding domain-containing protein [Parabacteroides sp.]
MQRKKFAFVYFPNGETVTLNLQPLENSNPLKLHWMNPRTGELNPYTNPEFKGGYTNVIPPSSGRGNDWILVVEQSDK